MVYDEEAPNGILSSPPLRRSRKPGLWHSSRFQTWFGILIVLLVFLGLFGGTNKVTFLPNYAEIVF